ncbi:MAG: hypothetical protein ABH886_03530 [Candidatus Desantisbacteria bacterium]
METILACIINVIAQYPVAIHKRLKATATIQMCNKGEEEKWGREELTDKIIGACVNYRALLSCGYLLFFLKS